ncbi:MAG: hypothetical protein ACRDQA_22275, partial [Nocardioidaceae bacterium]
VVRTSVPGLASSGTVSFVAGPGRVVIRPLDFVAGYAVPDDGAARTLTAALAAHGPLWPGPREGTVWLPGKGRIGKVDLVRLDGGRVEDSLPLPRRMSWPTLYSDRAGYLFANTKDGSFDIGPSGARPIPGTPVAAGPRRLLTRECEKDGRCHLTVIDRKSRAERALSEGPRLQIFRGGRPPFGVTPISPDGETAPLLVGGGSTYRKLHLLDLETGAEHPTDVRVPSHSDTLAWSPDSRWLFVATTDGDLLAINRQTGNGHRILPGLSHIMQVAFTAQQPDD